MLTAELGAREVVKAITKRFLARTQLPAAKKKKAKKAKAAKKPKKAKKAKKVNRTTIEMMLHTHA